MSSTLTLLPHMRGQMKLMKSEDGLVCPHIYDSIGDPQLMTIMRQRQGKSNQRAKWRARMCWWLPAVCLPMHARGSRWVAGQWLATAVRTTQVTRVMLALPLIPREVLELPRLHATVWNHICPVAGRKNHICRDIELTNFYWRPIFGVNTALVWAWCE